MFFNIVLILMSTLLCSLLLSLFKWGSSWFYSKLILSCPFSGWRNEGSVFSSVSADSPLSESSPSPQLQWRLYQLTPFLFSWLMYGASQKKEGLGLCSHTVSAWVILVDESGDVSLCWDLFTSSYSMKWANAAYGQGRSCDFPQPKLKSKEDVALLLLNWP